MTDMIETPEVEEVDDADPVVVGDVSESDTYDEPDGDSHPESNPAIAEMAKALGWKEPSDWKGDRTNYQSAEEFLAVKQRQFQRLEEKDAEIERLKREFVDFQKQATERFQRADEHNVASLKAELAEAAKYGDMERHARILSELEKVQKPKLPEPDPQRQYWEAVQEATSDPVYREWNDANPWYNGTSIKDQAKTVLANQIAQQQNVDVLRLPPAERRRFYDSVAAQVAEAYGEKRSGMPGAAMGGRSTARPGNPRGKSFDSLPREAREGFESLSRKGIFSNDDKGRAEYAKLYLAENKS